MSEIVSVETLEAEAAALAGEQDALAAQAAQAEAGVTDAAERLQAARAAVARHATPARRKALAEAEAAHAEAAAALETLRAGVNAVQSEHAALTDSVRGAIAQAKDAEEAATLERVKEDFFRARAEAWNALVAAAEQHRRMVALYDEARDAIKAGQARRGERGLALPPGLPDPASLALTDYVRAIRLSVKNPPASLLLAGVIV